MRNCSHRRSTLAGVLVAVAMATGARHAQALERDSVTGGSAQDFAGGFSSFVFNASSGPSGEGPSGTVGTTFLDTESIPPLVQDFGESPVTCLNVVGNRATVGFRLVTPSPINLLVFVQDLGGAGADTRTFSASLGDAPPTVCPIDAPSPLLPVGADIRVRDALAHPTSRAECKRGGFARFGFKTRRACIRFVKRTRRP